MRISMFRTDLPDWAKENMEMTCSECGGYILDNSDTGLTTARWCANPACPGHMAHKIVSMADYLGIKGIGPATALNYIHLRKFKSHFDIIPVWFKDDKPLMSLADIAVLACIEGYGSTQANKELCHHSNFEQYFEQPYANALLRQNAEMLIDAQKYFTLKPALACRQMSVMGTGSFHGYQNRDEFFRLINDAFGQYIHVIQTGKRKTGISYLIKEKDAVDHTKSKIAAEKHIPVVTPREFIDILQKMCNISLDDN